MPTFAVFSAPAGAEMQQNTITLVFETTHTHTRVDRCNRTRLLSLRNRERVRDIDTLIIPQQPFKATIMGMNLHNSINTLVFLP